MRATSHLLVVSLIAALPFLACSRAKVLDESGAKQLIQESLTDRPYVISAEHLLPLMSSSSSDYRTAAPGDDPRATIARLIKAGFVAQHATVTKVRNLTGEWNADHRDKYHQFQITQNNNVISGTCEMGYISGRRRGPWGSWHGTIEGLVEGDRVKIEPSTGNCMGIGHPVWFAVTTTGDVTYLRQQTWGTELTYSGGPPRFNNVTMYDYGFAPSVALQGSQVVAGKFEVGTVSNLHLEGETRAVADFSWRATLNDVGRALNGEAAAATGAGSAVFVKKPDGTWTLGERVRL